MHNPSSKFSPTTFTRAGLLLAAVLPLAALASGSDHGGHRHHGHDALVGVWLATVTQRDCASGTPLATFKGQQVFHAGGTLTDTNSAPPNTRGPGMGVWQRQGHGYQSKFRFARYFPDGNLAGYSVVTRHIAWGADRDNVVGTTSIELLDPAGTVVGRGCASDVAVRFE